MSDEDLLQEIRDLVAFHAERDVTSITSETRLKEDLRLDGKDAESFVNAFAAKYDVDMSAFVWPRYFADEGENPLKPWLVRWRKARDPAFAAKWKAASDAERSVDVAHLLEVAKARRWNHPPAGKTGAPHDAMDRTHLVFNLIGVLGPLILCIAGIGASAALLIVEGSKSLVSYAGLYIVAIALFALEWRSLRLARREIEAKLASAD